MTQQTRFARSFSRRTASQARVHAFSCSGFPTLGLAIEHWRTMAYSRLHPREETVGILDAGPGHLKVRVRTRFFMLYGIDRRLPEIQDFATPAEAYFAIERPFGGEAVITYQVSGF